MAELKVNADAYSVLVDNPTPNQPKVSRLLTRGEVFDFSDEEAKRGQAVTVRRFYDGPAGPATIMREEPALVAATEDDKVADQVRKATEEAAELERKAAELRASLVAPPAGTEAAEEDEPPRRPARSGR